KLPAMLSAQTATLAEGVVGFRLVDVFVEQRIQSLMHVAQRQGTDSTSRLPERFQQVKIAERGFLHALLQSTKKPLPSVEAIRLKREFQLFLRFARPDHHQMIGS